MDIFKIFVELTFYLAGVEPPEEYTVRYRTTFIIRGNKYAGEIEFIDKLKVTQGEVLIKAYIIFHFKELIEHSVSVGDKFTFGEESKTLGEGIVLKICDPT